MATQVNNSAISGINDLPIDLAMLRANQLSKLGSGLTGPNPIVGAVIIDEHGKEIASGFHSGQEHAEVVAINDAKGKGIQDFSKCIMVVTLEPCNHFGKTPPCTAALISHGFKNVVFAISDPNSAASGGAVVLKEAGINTVSGIQQNLVSYTNRAWLGKIKNDRPWIVTKIAATTDGKIAAQDGSSKWITSQASRADVAVLRNESDAIITTTQTVIDDDPQLTPRIEGAHLAKRAQNPVRVVVGEREIPSNAQINNELAPTQYIKSREVKDLLALGRQANWNQMMIEAGAKFNTALLAAGAVDEIILYVAPTLLGTGKPFLNDIGIKTLTDGYKLSFGEIRRVGADLRIQLFPGESRFASLFDNDSLTEGRG